MPHGAHRILTTHAGSLPRPPDLVELYRTDPPSSALPGRLREAVAEIVRRQRAAGIDLVNDGEFGKAVRRAVDYGAWATYVYERLAGFEPKPPPGDGILGRSKDRGDFSAFYAEDESVREMMRARPRAMVCTAPVEYVGQAALARDLDNLRAVPGDLRPADVFVTAVSPASIEALQPNAHYATQEDYGWAVARAMREEYTAIAKAGFVLQIDDPGLAVLWDWWFARDGTFAAFRKFAESRVEMLNHALAQIPEDGIRYHLCWGSWHGPHSTDAPLRDIVDLVLRVRAGAYSLEAGNVRHEHDWAVWRDVALPPGKRLIPGVVSHSTNVVEHPELVAERIVQYAELVGPENVIAGTDCGLGGRVHPQIAWAKLAALVEGAALASRRLFG
ncbi:MAG: cobalamin-independent methionine synthase II family protein [Burkholderiales bacterium]|nr:cobalamin-independent methionine synthase II family protein [Burkholderiales bacterium]